MCLRNMSLQVKNGIMESLHSWHVQLLEEATEPTFCGISCVVDFDKLSTSDVWSFFMKFFHTIFCNGLLMGLGFISVSPGSHMIRVVDSRRWLSHFWRIFFENVRLLLLIMATTIAFLVSFSKLDVMDLKTPGE